MDTTYINILTSNSLGILHRMALSKGLHDGDTITSIANELSFSRQTIHKEIRKGTITQRTHDLREIEVYDAYAAQYKTEASLSLRGRLSKIDDDLDLMNFIVEKLQNKYSPEVISHSLMKTKIFLVVFLQKPFIIGFIMGT